MSTLSISPAFVSGPAFARTRPSTVRLTRRGRVVVLLAILAMALIVSMSLGGWATASREGGAQPSVRIVEVQPGDTLYGIAGGLAKPGHIREMVHEIQQLNSLSGGGLQVGQKLALPVHGG